MPIVTAFRGAGKERILLGKERSADLREPHGMIFPGTGRRTRRASCRFPGWRTRSERATRRLGGAYRRRGAWPSSPPLCCEPVPEDRLHRDPVVHVQFIPPASAMAASCGSSSISTYCHVVAEDLVVDSCIVPMGQSSLVIRGSDSNRHASRGRRFQSCLRSFPGTCHRT